MPPKRASTSATPDVTNAEDDDEINTKPVADGSALPREQWDAMQELLNHIYDYRTAEYVACYATSSAIALDI